MDRFVNLVPTLKEKYLINGEAKSPIEECEQLGEIIAKYPVDVAFVGIGENGHLAFNDPAHCVRDRSGKPEACGAAGGRTCSG